MKLKCIKDNCGYYEEGKCYDVVKHENHAPKIIIEIKLIAKWNNNKPTVEIICTKEEFENNFIRNSDAEFEIIE